MSLVQISDVSKTFVADDQEYTAISHVSVAIEPDDFFCLLGPSGCGKTTVLNILAGFERPTSGTVGFDGLPVDGPSRERAVVFQADNSLYDWLTARENVEFGLRLRNIPEFERVRVAEDFLELVGLAGQGDKLPRQLSGGMRQRVQIARVLATKPRMLLMDEPFAALDAQTRRIMQDEMRRIWLAHKVGVLFITHDIEESLLIATRIGIMTSGPEAGIREIIEVPADMPRDRVDMDFVRMYGRVQKVIAAETDAARTASIRPRGPVMVKSATFLEHKQRARRSLIQVVMVYSASVAGLFLLWHLTALWFDSVLFPSPIEFMKTFLTLLLDGSLVAESAVSLRRILLGFILGCLIAIPLGLLMGSFRIMRLILEPYVEILRFIPSIAMITVAVIFLGIGEGSRVFLIAWVTVFTVAINTAAGVMSIEPNKVRAAASMGATVAQIFWLVTLPATVPFIIVGARIAMSGAFTTIVAAEIIGARSGLGTMLWQARTFMLVDNIYVVLVSLSLLGIAIDRSFRWASHAFGKRYAPHL